MTDLGAVSSGLLMTDLGEVSSGLFTRDLGEVLSKLLTLIDFTKSERKKNYPLMKNHVNVRMVIIYEENFNILFPKL